MFVSRRGFVATALAVPIASTFNRTTLWALSGSSGADGGFDAKLFPRPDVIRYDAECYTIRGVDTLIFSMECPYPRCPRAEWRDRFTKIRQAGFNTIDTYIFWNYHEREEGHFDFSELEEFLALAQESGFYVIVRPGPYVDAEFERGGFPAYVIAKRFPVRSMHPESLRTSKHWYDAVLPVIRRHQVTEGGSIILMQVENEIDFTDVPETEQREYIRFLARLAWDAGIEVPLISNVSSVVRDRTDPDMVRIVDVCDFYPRWSFLTDNELPKTTAGLTMEEKVGLSDRAVLASIRKMRRDEPGAPLSVAELGTGYYSKVGGKLSQDEEGADATQLNALTKTILEHGVTYLNYYLGWGGTNYDWSAKTVTTTYDFAAPIREWGGLWDKYYNARAIGAFLKMFGGMLARSQGMEKAARSTNPDMTVSQRACSGKDGGKSGFVFVRTDTEAEHHFKLSFRDTAGEGSYTVPRHGELTMGSRAMKMLPVQVGIAGGHLRYSTAEVLAQGSSGERSFLILYDVPGSLVEIAIEADSKPEIAGETIYSEWSEKDKTAVFAVRVRHGASTLLVDRKLLIVMLPRELALHTWVANYADGDGKLDVPFITDAYLLASSGRAGRMIWAEIDYLPGEHGLTMVLPSRVKGCKVDGVEPAVEFDEGSRTASLRLKTPAIPVKAIEIREVRGWVEGLDTKDGKWIKSTGKVLEDIGAVPFGYVKYRAEVEYKGEAKCYLRAFTDNPKTVFVNGKMVGDASKADRFIAFAPGEYFRAGKNVVEISYELFGSTEFGETARMAELNGMDAIWLGDDPAKAATDWEIQMFPAAMKGRALDADYAAGSKTKMAVNAGGRSAELVPAFAWCEAEFEVESVGKEWAIPLKLTFEADRDALIYLNGRFTGRYASVGPQTQFHLHPSYVRADGAKNLLTVVLAYTKTAGAIRTMRVEPYEDYSVKRSRIEIEL